MGNFGLPGPILYHSVEPFGATEWCVSTRNGLIFRRGRVPGRSFLDPLVVGLYALQMGFGRPGSKISGREGGHEGKTGPHSAKLYQSVEHVGATGWYILGPNGSV